ncbi:50S ribosomal protein L3 N(5)-glutamine methyltransferase [Massilia psychrophila]|jgi:ribosomal protein L3 glutamine methyltransferase|uniref:Ribosomal protein uL3 glutamine methyltransferase n=1 Tax=Massilia psychrophila TaxID=1603353 RepID=A0A2G8SZV2_9BURK|nr:50S ribosomal protein L3 N(5)-glutamine methyltransferase [Massilia psychrophila]PIL39304.1 50S ribosomal protein L3 N(5)-glutamine methyltransferase [Massilia psychrophila]GGE71492.1 50S ribosomal protein L3 glutamine methyltransferase [Massilia psychrophila]
MTTTQFTTPRDLLRYAVSRFNDAKLFFGHGSAEAFDEAAYLILHTLKLPLDKLEPFLDARLLSGEVLQVLAVIERRAVDRVPAAYITNQAWLGTYAFYVDERVLVPRSFIAELVPERFSPWVIDPDAVENILELCTGSGCLAIMMADAFQNSLVDAVDISLDALAVAEHNIRDYKLEGRVNPIASDLYQNVPFKKYDLIVTNPPYVNSDSMSQLPQEYLCEPQIALDGGADGMDLVRKIIDGAADYLTPEGILMVEIGNEREYAEAAFGHLGLTWLTTSAGDDMVFLLTAEQLKK